jgi:tetratricopeptide (TPR) repeat protein
MSESSETSLRASRVIRVFVSSTFRDMQAERDHLVKFTFPQLRKLCESRGVTWGEVDLRWGITDEEKAEGKVLPLCLEEIHRCRPYFIGLLGERYGWIPDSIPPEAIERESWLREHVDERKSVTELEILHGVLNNPEMADHAFFYLRDPAYVEHVSIEQRDDFIPEDAESTEKLEELKQRIRQNHFPVRENYADPKALGELVLNDFTELIEGLFPEGETLDPLDCEAADHEAFAQSLAKVYIRRDEYFDRLDEHVQSDGPPLVVLGESGSGKSALLANWFLQYSRLHPADFALIHFIGATPDSADPIRFLRRIMLEIKRRFSDQFLDDVPTELERLRQEFSFWLMRVCANGKMVLVLDGLDQLEDHDAAVELGWLPAILPPTCRVILSTMPGRSLGATRRRQWHELTVQPLTMSEREELIGKFLAQYSRRLSAERVERIASFAQAGNPLFLRAMLDELRQFGDNQRLGERIEYYLGAHDLGELYERILQRWEQDYGEDLVRESLSLILVARRGLSEAELLDLLGADGQPLPRLKWTPFFLAAELSFSRRSGLLSFSHNFIRQSVQRRSPLTADAEKALHLRLAGYFIAQPQITDRKIAELPWHLSRAESWQELFSVLADPEFLTAAWRSSQVDLMEFWVQIEAHTVLRVVDAYRDVLNFPFRFGVAELWTVANLLEFQGHNPAALSLREHLIDKSRDTGDKRTLALSLATQAMILRTHGRLNDAWALLGEAEQLVREISDRNVLQIILGHQGIVLTDRGEYKSALLLLKKKERICRDSGNLEGLRASLGFQAVALFSCGELDKAMALHVEEARLCEELGNKDGLRACLTNQALILFHQGHPEDAMEKEKQAEQICRDLGNTDGLQTSLGSQASILKVLGKLDAAMALNDEREQLCRELGNSQSLAKCLGNQARIKFARGDRASALRLHDEEEAIWRRLDDKDGLSRSLCDKAEVSYAQGDLAGAIALLKECEGLCHELGNRATLRRVLGQQARILRESGDILASIALLREKDQV